MVACRFVVTAVVLSLQGTSAVQVGAPSLDAEDADVQARIGALLTDFYSAAAPTTEAGQQDGAVVEKKDHTKKKIPGPPLKIQVPEKELQSLTAKLSPACKEQFNDIVHGRSALHTYGHPGTDSSSEGCAQLNGTLCAMDALVSRQQTSGGRSMASSTHVEGKGCLPQRCMSSSDLEVLAEFMRSKAKGAMRNAHGLEVQLKVDCSLAGGSKALVGSKHETEVVGQQGGASKQGAASGTEYKTTNQSSGSSESASDSEKPVRLPKKNAATGHKIALSVLFTLSAITFM